MAIVEQTLKSSIVDGPVPKETIAAICTHIEAVKKTEPGSKDDQMSVEMISELVAHRPGVLETLRDLNRR